MQLGIATVLDLGFQASLYLSCPQSIASTPRLQCNSQLPMISKLHIGRLLVRDRCSGLLEANQHAVQPQ